MKSRPLGESCEWPCNASYCHWITIGAFSCLLLVFGRFRGFKEPWKAFRSQPTLFFLYLPCWTEMGSSHYLMFNVHVWPKTKCVKVCVYLLLHVFFGSPYLLLDCCRLIDKNQAHVELFVYISECSAATSFIKSDEWVAHPPWILIQGQTGAICVVL